MLMDDEPAPIRSRLTPPPLDALGIAELQAYVAELKSEVVRAEAIIARKHDHRSAIDSVFRKP